MIRPWMALYPADYRADTAHLRTIEHGAYFLLILHYWTTGKLPEDDGDLSRIAGLSKSEWMKAKPKIQAFFFDGWKHKRIEFEMTEAARISAAGKAGGVASGKVRRERALNGRSTVVQESLNDSTNDPGTNSEALQLHKERKMQAAPALDEDGDLFRRGKQILGADAGSLISKLKKARGGVSQARAVIEQAATKENPREYVGRVLAGPAKARTSSGELYPEGII